jgi:hypothetical protein
LKKGNNIEITYSPDGMWDSRVPVHDPFVGREPESHISNRRQEIGNKNFSSERRRFIDTFFTNRHSVIMEFMHFHTV